MAQTYVVQQGDCLSSIAQKFGFASFRSLYDAPENAAFKQKRPNPNLIFPGDELVIPDSARKSVSLAIGAAHTIVVPIEPTRLRLALANFRDERQSGIKYTLTVDGVERSGESQTDGLIEETIPAAARSGTLVLPDFETRWEIQFGALDPIETLSGVQARLNNLGYGCGEVDGVDGPLTQAAVRSFQKDNPPLAVDGICGPKTRGTLRDRYGF